MDKHVVQRIRHALPSISLLDALGGYCTSAPIILIGRRSNQICLNSVPCCFGRIRSGPRVYGAVKSVARPPIRVASGEMNSHLDCPPISLANLVGCHEEAFTMNCARFVKLKLLGVWGKVLELIAAFAPFLLLYESAFYRLRFRQSQG